MFFLILVTDSDVCHYAKLRYLPIKRLGISAEKDLETLHLKLHQRYKELIKLDDKELREISRQQTEVVFELNKPEPWNKVWCKEFFLSGGLSYHQPYEPELILDSI